MVSLGLVALVAVAGTAVGAPTAVSSDISDNTFYFTYNADEGAITNASSSTALTKIDNVSFFVYVRDRDEAPDGRRLKAILSLRLLGKRALRYDGTFTLTIRGSGVSGHTGETTTRFTLRRKPSQRMEVVKLPFFDLPSGDYSASASFRA